MSERQEHSRIDAGRNGLRVHVDNNLRVSVEAVRGHYGNVPSTNVRAADLHYRNCVGLASWQRPAASSTPTN